MGRGQYLIGKRFDRLLVISFHGIIKKQKYWVCKCDCGNKTILSTAILNYGTVKSCGCLRNEKLVKRSQKHGYSKRKNIHPLYSVRIAFLSRCYNGNDKEYKNYGKRGIRVCEEWKNDPKSFISWGLSHGYIKGLTIDRKDNNIGYSPDNCRFISQAKQNINKRGTIYLTFKNKRIPLVEWAKLIGLKRETLYSRIFCYNWSIEKALTTPKLQSF